MTLTIREEAEADALTAALWYESRRDGLGTQFRDQLAAVYESICINPLQFGAITHRKVHGWRPDGLAEAVSLHGCV